MDGVILESKCLITDNGPVDLMDVVLRWPSSL